MGMGTGGIPTTDNIPGTTEKLGWPTDNIPDNRFFKLYCRVGRVVSTHALSSYVLRILVHSLTAHESPQKSKNLRYKAANSMHILIKTKKLSFDFIVSSQYEK